MTDWKSLGELASEQFPKTLNALNDKIMIVDPPGGWKYGFPAPLQEDYEKQLRDAGYPDKDIELALKWSRYWERREK